MQVSSTRSPRSSRGRKSARDYLAIAQQFQDQVLDGTFLCGRLLKAAVQRHVADLKRGPEFPFEFDAEAGARVARFVELLPHVEGPANLVGTKIRLEPWQVWAIVVSFGWVARVSRNPRFRRITLFMPKGQGKTLLCAAIAVYVLATDKGASTILSAATARDQARQAFDAARNMLLRSPDLCERFGLVVEEHAIKRPASGAKYVPISAEARTAEGKLPRLVVEDEIHAHPKRDLHDNLRSMSAKRPDSQTLVISTAGFDMSPEAIGYEVYGYAKDILEGRVSDESQFALLLEADPEDDPWDPVTWRKANPNFGVSIDPVEVENEANEAKQRPNKQPSFLTKRLGRWVKAASYWIQPAAWEKCADTSLRREDFDGPAFLGVDLATVRDLTAKVLVFVRSRPDGEREYTVFCDSYLAEESVTLGEGNDALRTWASEGWQTLTPGVSTSLSLLLEDIRADLDRYPGSEVCYDPWSAAALVQPLNEAGVTCIQIRQGAQTMSEPMKALEAAILSGRVRHDGNPLLAWAIGNVMAKADINGNLRPTRENESRKIDPAMALINAFVRAHIAELHDAYSSRGFLTL